MGRICILSSSYESEVLCIEFNTVVTNVKGAIDAEPDIRNELIQKKIVNKIRIIKNIL